MEKIDVAGLRGLRYAVVNEQNYAVSLHQHPDAAERFRLTSLHPDDFRVVELKSSVSYVQR